MITTNRATEKQQALITRLLGEKYLAGTYYEGWTPDWSKSTPATASAVIDYLLSLPSLPKAEAPAGLHTRDGIVYKVQVAKNGSGRKYAKVLRQEDGKWKFVYAPGAVRDLNPGTVMSAESASRFGALYGICVACGRDLTDERSIHFGYGPVCAANNGWPYGEVPAPSPVNCTDCEDSDGEPHFHD